MQPVDPDVPDLFGQVRVEPELAAAGLEPEHRLDEQERSTGRPRLRAARGRIRNGEAAEPALEPGEGLRQSEARERGCLELSPCDPIRLLAEPVAREPEGDQRVVMRPDRADVVAD